MLSTPFILRVLAAALLSIAGGFRVRGDPEQVYIFTRGFGFPAWLRLVVGTAQIASAVLVVFRPSLGLSPAASLATFLMMSHALRQGIPLAGILDLFVIVVVSVAGLLIDLWGGIPIAIGAGIAAFLAASAAYPKQALKKT